MRSHDLFTYRDSIRSSKHVDKFDVSRLPTHYLFADWVDGNGTERPLDYLRRELLDFMGKTAILSRYHFLLSYTRQEQDEDLLYA